MAKRYARNAGRHPARAGRDDALRPLGLHLAAAGGESQHGSSGVDIPAGANLLLMLHSANRDERVFPEPDDIIFERGNLKDQLAFGYGIHYCVGAPLAPAGDGDSAGDADARAAGVCGWWTGNRSNIRAISPSAVPSRCRSPGSALAPQFQERDSAAIICAMLGECMQTPCEWELYWAWIHLNIWKKDSVFSVSLW